MIVVAADPGTRPTLCRIDGDDVTFEENTAIMIKKGKHNRTVPVPSLIANILRRWAPDFIVIEDINPVGKAAGQDRSPLTGGLLMHAKGMLEGVAAGLGIPTQLVAPVIWTKAMGVPRASGPEGARLRALQINPALAQALSRKSDHNRAACYLIGRWAKEHGTHPLL